MLHFLTTSARERKLALREDNMPDLCLNLNCIHSPLIFSAPASAEKSAAGSALPSAFTACSFR
jgi:hypothetical protein